ncbi:MAG TPA: NAD(P)-dependent oxidoreductase [Stellaceae bacterium]|nr:NAD(P)-dependent oxidoreductase [Stellaceae bacterium]
MLPINVDLTRIRVMLVGDGAAVRRRLALLEEAGAETLAIYAPLPEPTLAALAGTRLRRRLPRAAEIARAQLVFVAGVAEPIAGEIRRVARAAGVLINVEDDRERSDFHSAAVIRRGDLAVAISTSGKSPGLAALMRQVLERRIGPEWEARADEIASLRQAWRAAGADPLTVGRRTREWAARQGWLDRAPPDPSQPPSRQIP